MIGEGFIAVLIILVTSFSRNDTHPLYEMEPLQNIIIMTGLERYHNNSRPLLYFIITELSSCYVVLCYEIISVGKATYVTLS